MKIRLLDTVESLDTFGGDEFLVAVKLADSIGVMPKQTEPAPGVRLVEFRSKLRRGQVYDVPNSLGNRLIELGNAESI